jgi:hypothetical protein
MPATKESSSIGKYMSRTERLAVVLYQNMVFLVMTTCTVVCWAGAVRLKEYPASMFMAGPLFAHFCPENGGSWVLRNLCIAKPHSIISQKTKTSLIRKLFLCCSLPQFIFSLTSLCVTVRHFCVTTYCTPFCVAVYQSKHLPVYQEDIGCFQHK